MPSQLLVGCKKKKKKLQSHSTVHSLCSVLAGKPILIEMVCLLSKAGRKVEKGDCSTDHSVCSCLCSEARHGFPRLALLTGHRGPSEQCETFPFQTHIPLPSSGQRTLLSAQTFPHSVFLLLNHWDLCLEYFLFPFQPALALEVRSLELPLLLVLSAYPYTCPTVVIQSLW